MRKIISFMHLSLDGFVAGPNGEMNWIKVDEEIFDHVGRRVGDTDTALYGRKTYDMMEHYWPTAGDQPNATKHDIEHAAWYKTAHKVVLSHTMQGVKRPNTTVIGNGLLEEITALKQGKDGAGEDILLFGSPTATHALIDLDLIDGYWLFVNPIVLGQGIPLFKDIHKHIKLNLLSTQSFACGVVELNYSVARP